VSIYDVLIEQATLLPAHRESLKKDRGFSDETIDRLKFRSCTPALAQIIHTLSATYPQEINESGLLIDGKPNPKLLKDNILIPYIDWSNNEVVHIRPHKDYLAGQSLRPYLPAPISSFCIYAESEFKAAAAHQWGYSAIGAGGVGAFSGKNFATLLKLLQSSGVSTLTIIYDNEIKTDPDLPNYQEDHWTRWDTQYHAILMARRLLANGIETKIATLPAKWMVDGKVDLDMALAQGKTKANIDEVVRLRLTPDNYLKTLPEEARRVIAKKLVRQTVPVKRMHNRYFIENEETGDRPVSNFVFDIDRTLIDPEGRNEREITLTNSGGIKKVAKLPLTGKELTNYRAFAEHCSTLGDFQYTGTQKEFQHIVTLESSRDIGKEVYQVNNVGWIDRGKEPGFYLMDNCAITGNGTLIPAADDGIVWSGYKGWQPVSIMREPGENTTEILHSGIPAVCHKELDPEWLMDQVEDNWTGFLGVRLAMSWLYSTFFSHWAMNAFNRHCFPLLFICGQKRAGKSTLCRWLVSMAGIKQLQGYGYWEATPAGIERVMGHYSSLPVWIDEYRNSSQDIARHKEGLFRSIYDRQSMLKAARIGKDYGIRGTQTRGCLIVSGEDTPEDPALQQRFVTIRMELKYIKDRANSPEFKALSKLIPVLSGIMPVLIKRFNERKDKVTESIELMMEFLIDKGVDDRTAVTYAIPVGIYDALVKPNDKIFWNFCADHAQIAFKTKKEEEPQYKFLEILCDLKAEGKINSNHVRVTEGDEDNLAINFGAAWRTWREGEVRIRRDSSFSQKSLLERFTEEDCFVERARRLRFGENAVVCLILDPDKDERVKSLYSMCLRS